MSRDQEACAHRIRAVELAPDDYSLVTNAATALRLLDRKEEAEVYYKQVSGGRRRRRINQFRGCDLIVPSTGGATATGGSAGAHQLRRNPAPFGSHAAGDPELPASLTIATRRRDHTDQPGQVGRIRSGVNEGGGGGVGEYFCIPKRKYGAVSCK